MKNFNSLLLFNKETRKILEFSRVNIIFGYSKSGKTTLLKDLSSVFAGKNKNILLNGTQTIPGDFNVFYIDSKDGIKDHLKLSSKSLLRKLILDFKLSDESQTINAIIIESLNKLKNELQENMKKSLPNLSLDINNLDDPLNLLLDNANVSLTFDSSTKDKEDLFILIKSLAKESKIPVIILIDDFNNDLDEETTINLLTQLKLTNAYFFLTSKRPVPQYSISNETSIFAVRDYKIYSIPDIEKLILDALEFKENNHTFEEYMLGNGYLKESLEYKTLLKKIQYDNMNNMFRILTSKKPLISNEPVDGMVTISPKNEYETKLYNHLFSILELDNN